MKGKRQRMLQFLGLPPLLVLVVLLAVLGYLIYHVLTFGHVTPLVGLLLLLLALPPRQALETTPITVRARFLAKRRQSPVRVPADPPSFS